YALPCTCFEDRCEFFKIDKVMNFVVLHEPWDEATFVLAYAAAEVARHAGVERAFVAAGENVHKEGHCDCPAKKPGSRVCVASFAIAAHAAPRPGYGVFLSLFNYASQSPFSPSASGK